MAGGRSKRTRLGVRGVRGGSARGSVLVDSRPEWTIMSSSSEKEVRSRRPVASPFEDDCWESPSLRLSVGLALAIAIVVALLCLLRGGLLFYEQGSTACIHHVSLTVGFPEDLQGVASKAKRRRSQERKYILSD